MEVLVRLGVQYVVTSPGSRSTPLTVAAARNAKIEAISVLDERSASFFALGIAKRSHRPVALVCTSGSALANYYPAVVEASMSGVPLILLTADRPPELQNCRAGQTIDQLKFFGDYVKSFHQVALPDLDLFDYLRQTLVHAVSQTAQLSSGPVHLNFQFRDPLAPTAEQAAVCDPETLERAATIVTRSAEAGGHFDCFDSVALERLQSHTHGVIIVGEENPAIGAEAFAESVELLSRKLGWPVLTDVLNPLRHFGSEGATLICTYDSFLRDHHVAIELKPTAILQIGQLPTSKVLRAWIETLDASSFLLSPRGENTDPIHRVAAPLYGSVDRLSEILVTSVPDDTWLRSWAEIETKTRVRLASSMDEIEVLFEGKITWILSRCLSAGSSLFIANSMSVRYAEYFWLPNDRNISVYCNRGANGIDGTVSTALGVAHGGRPAVLLTGDLAFLHDGGGLFLSQKLKGSLTIILVNNSGGGIFEFLPVSNQDDLFEEYFGTPQDVDVKAYCEGFGIPHKELQDWSALETELASIQGSGVRVLEIKTNRKQDCKRLKELLNPCAAR